MRGDAVDRGSEGIGLDGMDECERVEQSLHIQDNSIWVLQGSIKTILTKQEVNTAH